MFLPVFTLYNPKLYSLDTINGEDDFMPFRNVLHEFYAKDTSRKLKSAFKTKGEEGKHVTGVVAYGYKWDKNVKTG